MVVIKVVIASSFYMNIETFYCIEMKAFGSVVSALHNISKGVYMFI
jgi:hypothetical protein